MLIDRILGPENQQAAGKNTLTASFLSLACCQTAF
jgi:hypothetical protein